MKKLIFAIFALTILLLPRAVQGQEPLLVAPARQEVSINPGEKGSVVLRFFNQGKTPVTGFLKVIDFIVDDKNGIPHFLENPNQSSPRFSASQWIDLPFDKITIEPDNKVTVGASIDIPAGARPGGRYAAIYFEPSGELTLPPTEISGKAETIISSRLAGLLYIKVNGPITEQAVVSRLFTPSFYEYGPINVEAEILNRGDYHINPNGIITLTDMFGNRIDEQKLTRSNIFPDAVRSYSSTLGGKLLIGKFQLQLSATYGEKGQVLSRAIEIWVFPWKVAMIIILTIILIYLVGRYLLNNSITNESLLKDKLKKEETEIKELKEELKKKEE
jgi:hypothetical protein